MNCWKCGANNADDCMFCEECGADLRKPPVPPAPNPAQAAGSVPPVPPAPNPAQPAGAPQGQPAANASQTVTVSIPNPKRMMPFAMRALQFLKQHLLVVILLLVVLAALITGISVGNYLSNPKRVVDQYFSALKKGNWEKAYSQLYVKESDFVNYDAYEAMMEGEAKLYTGIGSYRIYEDGASSSTRKSKGSKDDTERLMRTYTVDYVTDRSTSNEMSVEVVKLSKKKFLFFPEYQISASNMLGSFTVSAPGYAKVTVDGVPIDSYKTDTDEENNYQYYSIDAIFYGVHEVSASSELTEEYTTTGSEAVDIYSSDMPILDSVVDTIFETAKSDLDQMITAACQGATLEDNTMSDAYKNYFYDSFYEKEETGMHNVKVTSYRDISDQTSFAGDFTYSCNIAYDYTYDYCYYDSQYQSSTRKWVDVLTSDPEESTGEAYLTYSYNGKEWYLSDIISNYAYGGGY